MASRVGGLHFLRRPLEKQVADIRDMSVAVSVRRLSQLSVSQQAVVLSSLPGDLARDLRSQLPVGVS